MQSRPLQSQGGDDAPSAHVEGSQRDLPVQGIIRSSIHQQLGAGFDRWAACSFWTVDFGRSMRNALDHVDLYCRNLVVCKQPAGAPPDDAEEGHTLGQVKARHDAFVQHS